MRTICTILLVVILMISLMAAPLQVHSAGEGFRRSIELATLAVGKNTGVVIPVHVEIEYPGRGKVIVETTGYAVSQDTRSSIEYAARLAARFSGKHFNDYNYKVVFHNEYNVSGLSATLTFTLGFALLLRNDPWDGNATATGLLAPNGVVGNISGIEYKYRAAREHGYLRIIGPYTPSLLDEKNFYPVSTFIESYEYFIGEKLYPSYVRMFEDLYINRSRHLFTGFYRAWRELYQLSDGVTRYISKHMDALPDDLRSYAKSFYRVGINSINESLVYINSTNYYTAASRAYYGFWNLLTVYNIIRYVVEQDNFMDRISREYDKNYSITLDHIRSKYMGNSVFSIDEIDIIVNAYERLFESKSLFEEAVSVLSNKSASIEERVQAIQYLSIAIARLYTARQWSNLIDYLGVGDNELFTFDIIREVALEEIELARAMYGYLYYLFGSAGREYIEEMISKPLTDARSAISQDPLYSLSEVMKIERDLSNTLLSIPRYTIVNEFVLEDIRKTIVRIMEWYLLYKNTTLPSGFTAIEFMETSGNLSLTALSTALLHMLVYMRLYSFTESRGAVSTEYTWLQPIIGDNYLYGLAIALSVATIVLSTILLTIYGIRRKTIPENTQKAFSASPPYQPPWEKADLEET